MGLGPRVVVWCFLFSIDASDCAINTSCSIVKYADGTLLCGLLVIIMKSITDFLLLYYSELINVQCKV